MEVPKGGQSLKNNLTWSCPAAGLTLVLSCLGPGVLLGALLHCLGRGEERDMTEENAAATVDSQGFAERNRIGQMCAFL